MRAPSRRGGARLAGDIRSHRVRRELADGIIEAQRREIAEMEWLLADIADNGEATTAEEAEAQPVPSTPQHPQSSPNMSVEQPSSGRPELRRVTVINDSPEFLDMMATSSRASALPPA